MTTPLSYRECAQMLIELSVLGVARNLEWSEEDDDWFNIR